MRSRMAGIYRYGLVAMTMLIAIPSQLLASVPTPAPEVDAASVSAAVGVVAAGVLILRSRRRTK